MKKFLIATALALLPLGAVPATAAVFDVPVATGYYTEFGGAGDLTMFDGDAAGEGFDHTGALLADLALSFDQDDRYDSAGGTVTLRSVEGEVLVSGVLDSILAEADDLLSLSFSGLTGTAAASFGPVLAAQIYFFDGLGADPLGAMMDGGVYEFALTAAGDPAPIPLPAGAVLLVSAFGVMVLRRKAA